METTEAKKIAAEDMSDAEAAAVFGEESESAEGDEVVELDDSGTSAADRMADRLASDAEEVEAPDWGDLPPGFSIPPGKRCAWMRFKAEWTDAPQKGDRWCLLWNLSEAEEKAAYRRAGGDGIRAVSELSKAMIRVIDSVQADRTGKTGPGNVNVFWAEIGSKLRKMIQSYYHQSHTLSTEEQADFFGNCFVVTTAVAG